MAHAFISEEIGHAKPKPAAFLFAARVLERHPEQVLFVGDSIADDIVGASAVGMPCALLDRSGKHAAFEGRRISAMSLVLPLVEELSR